MELAGADEDAEADCAGGRVGDRSGRSGRAFSKEGDAFEKEPGAFEGLGTTAAVGVAGDECTSVNPSSVTTYVAGAEHAWGGACGC